ncbi:Sodium-dependent multivitamin transporter, partial [Bulinus truncatus]
MRLIGTIFGIIQLTSYMTIALLSPGLALQTVGIPLWLSIILIGAVGTIYTAIGGFKAVIWTDVLQTCLIFLGIVVILIKGIVDVGGLGQVVDTTSRNGRLVLNDFSVDPRVRHTVWGLIIGGFIYWSNSNFIQTNVSRIVSLKSEKDARNVSLICIPPALIYGIVALQIGLVIVTYTFTTGCDPLAAGNITSPNQLMAYFVMKTSGPTPGLTGLFLASVFSASLSTLSSGIHSLTTVTVEDILGKVLAAEDDDFIIGFTKLLACAYGVAIILLAYLVREFSGPATELTYSVIGTTAGPILGLFVLGATFPQANAQGAVIGSILSMAISVWVTTGSFFYGTRTPPLPPGSTDRCSPNYLLSNWTLTTLSSGNMVATTLADMLNTSSPTDNHPSPVFIYDLSYVWISSIGLFFTLAFGLTFSYIY